MPDPTPTSGAPADGAPSDDPAPASSSVPVSPPHAPRVDAPRPIPTVLELFVAFAKTSASGFGGVMAWARRMLVQEKRWMSAEEFTEMLALCQVLPGPNIVNVSAVYGARVHGLAGALACLAGLLGPPLCMMLVVAALYGRYGTLPEVRGVLAGLAAFAAGLLIATAVQMAEPLARRRLTPDHAVALVAFVAIGVLRLPLLPVLAILVPVSVALAWWVRR
jgi:chromate transporter